MEQKNIKLDENWVPPSILAAELGVVPSTVTNWIKRGKIHYYTVPGLRRRNHWVDRRTAPAVKAKKDK